MNNKKMSLREIKGIIVEQLDESGIDLEQIEILVKKGPVIIIRGEVYSEEIRGIINQIINDAFSVDDIIDELEVINDSLGQNNDTDNEEDEYSDDDHDVMGTEDVFKSIEDGIPYIPPTRSVHEVQNEEFRQKRKKKKQ